jgi:hypothetical protein
MISKTLDYPDRVLHSPEQKWFIIASMVTVDAYLV